KAGASLGQLAAILTGRSYHPAGPARQRRMVEHAAGSSTGQLLAVVCGFITGLYGNWGLAVSPDSPSTLDLTLYFPRLLIALLGAAIVAQDTLRNAAPHFGVWRATFTQLLRYTVGLSLVVPFGVLKCLVAGLGLEFGIITSLRDILW